MSFGIALAGGGARGAAHVGVLLALEEYGLRPSSIAGTSVGSIIAGLYASGVTPKEMEEMVISLSKVGYFLIDPDIKGILRALWEFATKRPITLNGLIKGNKLERYFAKMTKQATIKQAKLKTVIPAVDINTANTIVFTNSSNTPRMEGVQWRSEAYISEAIRGSIAVPTIFQPKQFDDMCLVDGGVTDLLPVNLLIAAGEPNVLAVDISNTYQVIPNSHNILEISAHSLSIMSDRLKQCNATGERLLLKPRLPDDASLLTFDHMVECMNIGYEATIKMLPAIKMLFK